MFTGRGRAKVVIERLSCRRKDASEGVVKLCFIPNRSICQVIATSAERRINGKNLLMELRHLQLEESTGMGIAPLLPGGGPV